MVPFGPLLERATIRSGGQRNLQARLPRPKTKADLADTGDDRYLSMMSLRIFRAGLKHALVDSKWPAFEEAFHGFAPKRVAMMSDEDLDDLMANRALIRHWTKICAVRSNATSMVARSTEHGGFGSWVAGWPGDDIVGLWEVLSKEFRQLGGNSGPSFLRMAGKDTFVLTGDVVGALIDNDIITRPPTGKAAKRQVAAAFNAWADEAGLPLCQLSMILALSRE